MNSEKKQKTADLLTICFKAGKAVKGFDSAKEAVETLMANGIINGKNGKIDPKANATRAEVAVMLNRVLDLVK